MQSLAGPDAPVELGAVAEMDQSLKNSGRRKCGFPGLPIDGILLTPCLKWLQREKQKYHQPLSSLSQGRQPRPCCSFLEMNCVPDQFGGKSGSEWTGISLALFLAELILGPSAVE